MVFEAVVADVLNKVLGDYIENLDHKQLKIGIWGGDVVLTNLKIRGNALDEMDLPVQLVYGYLGKLVLKIPWKNLYSQPVIVNIEDLYALVTPNNNVKYNAEKEAKYELLAKQAALNAYEDSRKVKEVVPKGNAGFAEKLTAQIVNNLQVKIHNVHLRYEDTTTTGSPFSFGITLHELELDTTDSNWDKCYMAERAPQVFKIANLSCLSAYMNCHGGLYMKKDKDVLSETFQKHIASKSFKPANYCYVLGPISCNAKLKLNMNPELDEPAYEKPKVDLNLEMEKLNVGLTNKQFHNIMQLADSMNRMQLGIPYRKYRPYDTPVKGNAQIWWKFAITAVLEEDIRRPLRTWNWPHMKQHRELCNAYAQKYKDRELTKKPPAMLLEACNLLEQELDVFNLLLIRQRVNIEVDKLQLSQATEEKTGWFSSWWGGSAAKENESDAGANIVKKFEAAMTREEKEKMFKAIGYEENAKPQDLPEDYVAIKMNFKLIALEVGLYQELAFDSNQTASNYEFANLPSIMLLQFSMATASVKQRPGGDAISVTAGMKELKLLGLTRENYTPLIIESIITDEFNLLDVFFETNPHDKQCDQRLKIVARPLQIIYDAETILSLTKIFTPEKNVNLSNFEKTAALKLSGMKERSATGMQYMIDQKSVLDADILLMPNIIVVPHGGLYVAGEKSLVVLSLGQVHLVTIPHQRSTGVVSMFNEGAHKASILKNVMDNAYDKFIVTVSDIQLLVARPNEDWKRILNLAVSTDMHVLQPTSLELTAAVCVFDNDPRMPKIRIDILLPSIQLSVTDDRMFEAIGVATSIPLPQSEEPMPILVRSRSSISNLINREIKKRSTTTAKSIQVPTAEIVQYTNVEVNFSLNEVTLTMYEAKPICEVSFNQQVFFTPEQEVSQLPMVQTPDETISLDEHDIARRRHIISLRLLQLEAFLAQRTYETVASLKLGGINIKQYDCGEENEQVLDVIDTPAFTRDLHYLFTVSYTLADKVSPEFHTKYNSTEQFLVANFEVLDIVLHQECLLNLLAQVNKFQNRLSGIMADVQSRDHFVSAGDGDGLKHKLHVIMEDTETIMSNAQSAMRRTRAPGSNRPVIDSIKIRVVANLNEVSLKLVTRSRPLASMYVKNFVGNVTLKDSYTEVNIGLKDIMVIDLNPHTIHKNILSMVGQDAFHCQVVLYNKEYTRDYNSDDMMITVDIGCMKIIYLNWFVTGVVNFLSNFQMAQQALSNASAAAAETARMNAIDAYERATRLKLNIRVKAPILVIPEDSNSKKALAFDLGLLELTNCTSEQYIEHLSNYVVIDEIQLQIKDVKLTKVTILDGTEYDDHSISIDETDAKFGMKPALTMMAPMSFTLAVTRNLSNTWYKEIPEINLSGRLKSVELTLHMDDYALVVSIMNHNLNEGVFEFPPPDVPKPTPKPSHASLRSRPTRRMFSASDGKLNEARKADVKVYEALKFNFQFDGVVINLMESEHRGLACFGIYFLSIKGTRLSNDTLSVSTVLCNIQLDDTRANNKSQIRRYLTCKDWEHIPKEETFDYCAKGSERNFMLDITAIIKANDTFAEVRVRSFDLILCIDYMLKLATFLTLPADVDPTVVPSVAPVVGTVAREGTRVLDMHDQFLPQSVEKKINLILHIDEPDIILVESLNDLNTNAIIFNAQVHLNYRAINDKQIINGQIDALKMYMCSFLPERRAATRHYILHPSVISLQGSTPEHEGLHISLKLSDIIINVSPATIELFNKAMLSISSGAAEKAAIEKEQSDYGKIWYPKPFTSRTFWFTKVEEGSEAIYYEGGEPMGRQKTEKCVIEVPSITIVIETGVGYYTKPLISLDTRMTAVFNNWSRSLSAHGSLTLNMNYYNQFLAEWEPIIELNEVVGRNGVSEYIPWELQFDLEIVTVPSEVEEDEEEKRTNIRIHSKETLEITLSKTCVRVLNELGEAFSRAIDDKGMIKPEVVAPYVVQNSTGFDITLNLKKGIFTLHEIHRGGDVLNNAIVLHSTTEGQIVNPEDIQTCTISAGGRAFLQTKDISTMSDEQVDDYFLYVTIGNTSKEIALPVSKSDERYFPLLRSANQEQWAIVSEVKIEYGTTVINIHGILKVHNHFTTLVGVYRRKISDNTDVLIGYAKPGKIFNVPLHAIYGDTKELFFSLSGYHVSIQGVSWYANLSDLNYSQQLQCDPIETFEALYINTLRKKQEIYFENTSKYRIMSAVYTIHLRPPLYLRNSLPIDIRVSVAGCAARKTTPAHEAQALDTLSSRRYNPQEDFLDYGDKEVNPGHVLHLPTVRMFRKDKEFKSVLVVRLLNYLEKDWSYATEVSDNDAEITVWKFSSYDSEVKMDMELYVRSENRFGSLMLTLFSPFWMINKTGMMLSYKTELSSIEVLYHPPEYSGPILFTFRDKMFFDKKKASIRIDNGEWSEKIPLDVAGSIGNVLCYANHQNYQIGVHNHLTQNSLTKQITFIPFYIVRNKCRFVIELQELKRPGDPWLKLETQQCEPLWPKNDSTHKLIVRVNNKITPAFDYTAVTCTLLKLNDCIYGGVNVDVQTTEGGVYITFTEYQPSEAPGLLINHTNMDIVYYEKDTSIENVLKPKHSILHAWSDPTGPKILVFGKNNKETDLKRDEIDTVILHDESMAYWVSFLDGMQRVLLFTEIESIAKRTESSAALQTITRSIDLHIHGIGISVINNETGLDILYLGITSSGIIWEYKKPHKTRFKEMTMQYSDLVEAEYQRYLIHKSVKQIHSYKLDNKFPLNFDKMTILKNNDRKLKRSFYPAIWASIKSSPYQNQVHVKINRIQVDNQLIDPVFPVVLAPIPPPKTIASNITLKPFIECSVVQRIIPNSEVKQFKYATILIQEFHFKVDILFLTAMSEMFSNDVNDEQAAQLLRGDVESIEQALSAFFEQHSQQEQKNFYDNLHLGPLKIHVSFSMAGSDTTVLPGFLGALVQGVGVTLTDINDVVFRLAFFEREYQFFTQQQLISEVTSHYTGQALKQLYVLALGLDVLGNPYGLVVGLKKGVEDLFYEPFQGAIQGPGEFAEGLVLGVKSLFGHTVGGAAGAMSKITGAMGKGLAALTFDEDYQRKRRRGMNNKPRNFHEGLARSGKGLVMGFVDGVTGVVTKPVSGAREQGVEGFFKGLGKGAIGLVARPTAGVVDFASGSFEAVKRATEGTEDIKRQRPQRFQHYDNVLRPYCHSEALGNRMLRELDKGKFASTDSFIHCEEIVQKLEYLLVTNHRVIYSQRSEMFGMWTSMWSYQWNQIESIVGDTRGVQFTVKREGKRILGLFSTQESPTKLILVPDERKRNSLVEIMESQRTESAQTLLPSSRYK